MAIIPFGRWTALNVARRGLFIAFAVPILAVVVAPLIAEQPADGKEFKPAASPKEAVELFRDCLRARDYATAARYCRGDYAVELNRSATAAAKLEKAIDKLAGDIETVGINSIASRIVLVELNPFPGDFEILELKQLSADKTIARLRLLPQGDEGVDKYLAEVKNWQIDPRIISALAPSVRGIRVGVWREGKVWKLQIPIGTGDKTIKEKAAYLRSHADGYARALDNISYTIRHDAVSKRDLEEQLQTELKAAKSAAQQAGLSGEGFKPAGSPQEALELFRECLRARDYAAAARYCGGDYAAELNRSAAAAAKLGKAIDELSGDIETVGINSGKVRVVLAELEPFPREFKISGVKQSSAERAVARLDLQTLKAEDIDQFAAEVKKWQVDPRIISALAPAVQNVDLEIRREGKEWKLHLPVDAGDKTIKEKAAYLGMNVDNYVRALDCLRYAILHDAATKQELEEQTKKELEWVKE
jgi:tetratricopeptide (TPR) repeat protein